MVLTALEYSKLKGLESKLSEQECMDKSLPKDTNIDNQDAPKPSSDARSQQEDEPIASTSSKSLGANSVSKPIYSDISDDASSDDGDFNSNTIDSHCGIGHKSGSNDIASRNAYSKESIFSYIANLEWGRLSGLLHYIIDNNHIQWCTDTGEISYCGVRWGGSDIISLLLETLYGQQKALYLEKFLTSLHDIQVPLQLIADRKCRSFIEALNESAKSNCKKQKRIHQPSKHVTKSFSKDTKKSKTKPTLLGWVDW